MSLASHGKLPKATESAMAFTGRALQHYGATDNKKRFYTTYAAESVADGAPASSVRGCRVQDKLRLTRLRQQTELPNSSYLGKRPLQPCVY